MYLATPPRIAPGVPVGERASLLGITRHALPAKKKHPGRVHGGAAPGLQPLKHL